MDQFRTLVFLFACTGMRFSKLRGLRWMDVDFASSTLVDMVHRFTRADRAPKAS